MKTSKKRTTLTVALALLTAAYTCKFGVDGITLLCAVVAPFVLIEGLGDFVLK